MIRAAENKLHFRNATTALIKNPFPLSLYSAQLLHSLHSQLFTPPTKVPVLLMARTSPQSAEVTAGGRRSRELPAGRVCSQTECPCLGNRLLMSSRVSLDPDQNIGGRGERCSDKTQESEGGL